MRAGRAKPYAPDAAPEHLEARCEKVVFQPISSNLVTVEVHRWYAGWTVRDVSKRGSQRHLGRVKIANFATFTISGSWRRMDRSADANVSPIIGLTGSG